MSKLEQLEIQLRRTESELIASQRRVVAAEASGIEARRREQQAEDEKRALKRAIEERDRSIARANRLYEAQSDEVQAIKTSRAWRAIVMLRRLLSNIPSPVRGLVRRVSKSLWWLATPWRMPARLRFIRDRREAVLGFASLTTAEALEKAAGVPRDQVVWPRQTAREVIDKWSAARFCIDLLRSRPDVRSQFPEALSAPRASGFLQWVTVDAGSELCLSLEAREHVAAVLRDDFGARARQAFMFRVDVRSVLPHGLTPPGQLPLFRWFMRHGKHELRLRTEEIVWLFLQASENPALELVRAFQFTAAWQRLHPDGLTVFGQDAFAHWFVNKYKVAPAAWTAPSAWPVQIPPARQLRQAWLARLDWQALYPGALRSVTGADIYLKWLQSDASPVSNSARDWCKRLATEEISAQLVTEGVNVIGHFCCPSGVRVSAESLVEGMRRVGIQTALRDLKTDVTDEPRHVQFDEFEDFDTTIIHTQPEPLFSQAYARSDLHPRAPAPYRIAYWYWEFDSVPASWSKLAYGVDEVWTATEFVAKGLRERLDVPVRTMFPGVRLGPYKRRDRSYFGIEPGTFTFLFNFHMNSVMERKNPVGLVRAFAAAFKPREPVTLVVKTMFGHKHPEAMAALREAAAGARVLVIDEMYDADEVLSLTDACDAYVSLHRSEGLGLTMAEAMLMGKPVIGTNYSGNVDFMNDDNSLLVPYRLVQIGRPMPPYAADLWWAEPSLEHASALMRRLVDEPDWAREMGARAKASAEVLLSVDAAGLRIAQRLAEIRALRGRDR